MKKYFKKILAVVLVATMTLAIIPQLSASAAGAKKYISDLKISYEESGKQQLTDAGYTVIKQDVNKDANTGSLKGNNRAVYIGYKTTEDPTQAITDVAMMSEECGYSFSDYQDILKKEYSKYEVLAEKEMNIIKEFRVNYKNKTPFAMSAYEALNNFKEDDSGKLVGDYLLDESLSIDDLFKFITQISQYTLSVINTVLAGAIAETTDNNLFTRLSNLSNAEIAAIQKDNSFYDDAKIFYEHAQTLKADIKTAEGKFKIVDESEATSETEKEIDMEDVDGNAKLEEEFVEATDGIENFYIAQMIKTVKYGDKTLYDVIMAEEITIQDFYPLAKVMTRGQADAVSFTGFTPLFSTTNVVEKDKIEEAAALVKEDIKKPEVVSVYFGVDRSMFTDAVAVTSKATREMASTGDSTPMWGNISSEAEIALVATAAVSGAVALTIGSSFLGMSIKSAQGAVVCYAKSFGSSLKIAIGKTLNTKSMVKTISKNVSKFKSGKTPINAANMTKFMKNIGFAVANIAFYVAIAVVVIVTLVLTILELYNYFNPVYAKRPKILLDLYDEGDDSKFIRYDAVLGLTGEVEDVNGYVGKKWNCLYTTKDPIAGKPLEANTLTFADSTKMTDKNYKGVHSFGETASVNLKNYTFGSPKAIYLYFRQNLSYKPASASNSFPGSIFSNTTANIAVVTGIGGIGIGFIISTILLKRKMKIDSMPTQNTTSGE